jgi:hypothetical protein
MLSKKDFDQDFISDQSEISNQEKIIEFSSSISMSTNKDKIVDESFASRYNNI